LPESAHAGLDRRSLGGVSILAEDGRAITDAWASNGDVTWREAGRVACHDAARGEAIRRRVRYLANELARRGQLRQPGIFRNAGRDR
jgi:hypothetical protein